MNVLCAHPLTRAGTDGHVRVDGPRDLPEIYTREMQGLVMETGTREVRGNASFSASGNSGGLDTQQRLYTLTMNSNKNSELFSPFDNSGSFLKFKKTLLVTEEAHYLAMLGE